ncbi:hypothetical protein [Streptomyces sp. enrichment culture]|uniref:hypothetical protein n=1 Tax=Streptomyces sp. enrichment culture TaxID=1795815 RepID=UPI003F554556|nr:hypothetical protein [Streptomyces werraensis]
MDKPQRGLAGRRDAVRPGGSGSGRVPAVSTRPAQFTQDILLPVSAVVRLRRLLPPLILLRHAAAP